MDFATSLMQKYGWKDGDGLGKDKSGISQPIKIQYHYSTTGLGHKLSDEINDHWWSKMYEEASANINVQKLGKNKKISFNSSDSEKLKNNPFTKKSNKKDVEKKEYLGAFQKGGTLVNEKLLEIKTTEKKIENKSKSFLEKMLSDSELIKACEGRTVHKGARHGLKLSGKLARLQAQEEAFLATMNLTKTKESIQNNDDKQEWTVVKKSKKSAKPVSVENLESDPISELLYQTDYQKISKKRLKELRKNDEKLTAALSTLSCSNGWKLDQSNGLAIDDKSKEIKKKKKKNKNKCKDISEQIATVEPEINNEAHERIHIKSKKSKQKHDTEPVLDENVVKKKNKKSKKRKTEDENDDFASAIDDIASKYFKEKRNKTNKVENDDTKQLSEFEQNHINNVVDYSKKFEKKKMKKLNKLSKQLELDMKIL